MKSYLETAYPKTEYSETEYPQRLCNYISKKYFSGSGKLLDVGCGRGNHLIAFRRLGYKVYGLDRTTEVAEILRDFIIKQGDVEIKPFPYKNNTFDWVWCKSLLEHIKHIDYLMQEILRVLKPGGKAILLTPDWKSQMANWFDDYSHVRAFTRKGLQNTMKLNGFENVEVSLFYQLPFIWKYPYLSFIPKIISLLPDSLKWKDSEESNPRKLIRFSKEKMLLGIGEKL